MFNGINDPYCFPNMVQKTLEHMVQKTLDSLARMVQKTLDHILHGPENSGPPIASFLRNMPAFYVPPQNRYTVAVRCLIHA